MTASTLDRALATVQPTSEVVDWSLCCTRAAAQQSGHALTTVFELDTVSEVVTKLAADRRSAHVLDVLCGEGELLERTRPARATGLEVCGALVPSIKTRFSGLGDDWAVREASFFDAGWYAQSVDVVVACRVPNLVPAHLLGDLLCSFRDVTVSDGSVVLAYFASTSADQGEWSRHCEWCEEAIGGLWPVYRRLPLVRALADVARATGADVIESVHDVDGRPDIVFEVLELTWQTDDRPHGDNIKAFRSSRSHCSREQLNSAIEFDEAAEQHRRDRTPGEAYRSAVDRTRIALTLPPANDPGALLAAGSLALKLSMFEEGAMAFSTALADRSDDALALLQLGYCYEGLGRFDDAIANAKRAAAVPGSNAVLRAEIQHGLAHFHVGKAKETDDIDLFTAACEAMATAAASPGGEKYLNCLGSIHAEVHQYFLAVLELRESLRHESIQENDILKAEVEFYLSQALVGAGNKAEAESLLTAIRIRAEETGDGDLASQVAHWQAVLAVSGSAHGLTGFPDGLGTLVDDLLMDLVRTPPSLHVARSVRRLRIHLIELLALLSELNRGANGRGRLYVDARGLERFRQLRVGMVDVPLTSPWADSYAVSVVRLDRVRASVDVLEDLDVLVFGLKASEQARDWLAGAAAAFDITVIDHAVRSTNALEPPSMINWIPCPSVEDLAALLDFLSPVISRREELHDHSTPKGQAPLGDSPSRKASQAIGSRQLRPCE